LCDVGGEEWQGSGGNSGGSGSGGGSATEHIECQWNNTYLRRREEENDSRNERKRKTFEEEEMNERPAQEQCKPKAKRRKKLFESLACFKTLG